MADHPIERSLYREQTYRSHEAAYRAFYKWVAKHDLYGHLYVYFHFKGEPVYRRDSNTKLSYSGTGYANGYPVFRSWRNEAYRCWNIEFLEAKERLTANLTAQRAEEYDLRIQAYNKLYDTDRRRTRNFFKVIHAAGSLKT